MTRQVFEGQWNDGEQASSSPVSVAVEADGLSIQSPEGAQIGHWTFAELVAASPIKRASSEALLGRESSPRERLFMHGAGLGEILLETAPRIGSGAERLRIVRYGLVAATFFVAIGAVLFFGGFSLSRTVANWIPQEAADKIGLQSIELFGPVAPACEMHPGKAVLQQVLNRLQQGGSYGPPFKLHIARAKMANAFALPGRHIVLLSGLVKEAKSPEEVAGIMAHEMGHGLEKDPETLFVRHVGMQTFIQLLTGQSGGQSAFTVGALLLQLRYSRVAERSADAHAIEILRNAHIGPKPTADFFLRHGGDTSDDKSALNYLSTHPSSRERATLFLSQPDYEAKPIISDKLWSDAQGICDEETFKKPKEPDKKAPDKQKVRKA